MTTDTKVGLIVGLAFIVVFAIILSNRGQRSQLAPPLVDLADAEAPLDPLLPTNGRPAGTTNLFVESNPQWPGHDAVAADRPMTRAAETPANAAELEQSSTVAPERPTTIVPSHQNERRSPARLPDATPTREMISPPVDTPTLPPVRPAPPTHVATNDEPRPVVTGGKTHVVQKGDLLAKIANEAYGSTEKGLVDALAEYNNLSSPDRIVIGQKLRIPPIEALAAAAGAAKPPVTAPQQAPPPVTQKTYVVQAGDTLTSIARAQLGSTARWREIQKLNNMDDPNHLIEGMKLKLPPTSVAAATRTGNE